MGKEKKEIIWYKKVAGLFKSILNKSKEFERQDTCNESDLQHQ